MYKKIKSFFLKMTLKNNKKKKHKQLELIFKQND